MFHLWALATRYRIAWRHIAGVTLIGLAGCSTSLESYEGGGDHRFFNASKAAKSEGAKSEDTNFKWDAKWDDKYQSLESRAQTSGKFHPGDKISIYLKSAYFKYISEGSIKRWAAKHTRNSGHKWLSSSTWHKTAR